MKRYALEHDAQVAVFQWAKLATVRFPDLRWLFAIPNGGHRHIAVASRMQAEGMRAGVPDMCLPVARHGFHGLFIELKRSGARPKRAGKGPVSDVQLEWLDGLAENGYLAQVCYGSAEAIEMLSYYVS